MDSKYSKKDSYCVFQVLKGVETESRFELKMQISNLKVRSDGAYEHRFQIL